MTVEKVGLKLFIILLLHNGVTVFSVVLALKFGVAVFFYFSLGEFSFAWADAVVASVRIGGAVGGILGVGIWVMSKIESIKK